MNQSLALIIATFAPACGSSSGGSGPMTDVGQDSGMGMGVTGDAGEACDAADAGRDCTLSMPVQGALTGTLDGQTGCGTGSGLGSGGTMSWNSSVLGGRVTATFMGALPEQPGTYTLASLQVRSVENGGAASSWTAPSGACTIMVASVDIECQGVFRQYLHILHGTGSCTQAAAADPGTTAGPVTVGNFEFSHWLPH